MNNNACLFTIVSRNYLHFARTLMESAAIHAPWMERIVCLCDSAEGLDEKDFNFRLITLKDLPIPKVDAFIFQYTILELNTAIKPFVFEWIFKNQNPDQVFYFDPDICIYSSLSDMGAALEKSQMLLTPHLTDLLDDGMHPNELAILQSGTYNLGYLGLRNTPDALKFLTWWQSKMLRDCVVDIPRGLFVDQKWMDLVPGMYADVRVERNPGWNTAYWNINHRHVTKDGDRFMVDREPLVFFHFSGVGLDGKVFSKHQDRFSLKNLVPAVRELMDRYVAALNRNQSSHYSQIEYAFARFSNGTPIPDIGRAIYREHRDNLKLNLEDPKGEQLLIAYLNGQVEEIGRRHPLVSRLAYKLYQIRNDLRLAFPDVLGADAMRYAEWFIDSGAEQAKLADCFIEPIRREVAIQRTNVKALPTPNREGGGSSQLSRLERTQSKVWQSMYGMIWRNRGVLRRFVSYKMRHKAHAWLLRSAFKTNAQQTIARDDEIAPKKNLEHGLNVLGYLHAESGIGQSVRSTLSGLNAANIEVDALDFRLGNVSRMDAEVSTPLAQHPRFAVNLFHINADQTGLVHQHVGADFFSGRYNIGYWAWELPEFPDEWCAASHLLQEVWVPSTFCQEAIAAKIGCPVLRMPHCIEPHEPTRLTRKQLGLPEQGFLFGFIFDVLSVVERKNPFSALRAFRLAFGHSPKDVKMVLKLMNTEHNPKFMKEFLAEFGDDMSIVVLSDYLSRTNINGLLENIDCYVSLHRSEGFGLTLAEAMSMGKPVIATGWSGNMDFMNTWNSFPVRYQLIELEQDHGPYKRGCHWADPSVEHAATCMRQVVEDSDLRGRIGDAARQTIAQDFSPQALGTRVQARLDVLRGTF
jgi:glycosyltransferase involved in cell wall biosynthesis